MGMFVHVNKSDYRGKKRCGHGNPMEWLFVWVL